MACPPGTAGPEIVHGRDITRTEHTDAAIIRDSYKYCGAAHAAGLGWYNP